MKTICIAGKNDIAVNVLLHCINNYSDVKIIAICNKNDTGKNCWQKSFLWYAQRYNIDIQTLNDVYEIEDLIFLSVEYDRIIKPEKLVTNKLYNIHFSLLPKYKGCHTSLLPILHGQNKTGVTLHRIDSGIDTGEIIDQEEIDILQSDTAYDLYKKLIKVGTEIVIKNLPDIMKGIERSRCQDVQGSTYYSLGAINYREACLNVNTTAYQIQNQIRAFCFRPYQLLRWNDDCYIECKILGNRSMEKPGTILEDTETCSVLSTIDYDVKLYKDVLLNIFSAIEKGENARAKSLCVSRQIINAQDNHGWSPLIVATYNGNFEMVKYLIQCGADIYVKNWNGTTLLMYAKDAGMKTGNWTTFRLLIDQGLDCNEKDYYGNSLLDYILKMEDLNNMPDDIRMLIGLSH